ncbi:MAG TPA: hypothetical protein VL403_16860, partial [Candidatus Kryptonia bacterium]|nr:hypothetical protein [Candidatus Kryptonia bacterium]
MALAGGVVGTGDAGSCTDAALNTALAGRGLVTFNCGSAPAIIDISIGTGTKTISADTTIDGGSLITISGGKSVAVFRVNDGVTFTVQNLTIANGSRGIANNNGTVTVTNSTFSNNSADVNTVGGGICNYGTATVTNSTFSGNRAPGLEFGFGGLQAALYTKAMSPAGGGAIFNGGTLTVTNSTFSANSGLGSGIF